jgi:hypothetical protein
MKFGIIAGLLICGNFAMADLPSRQICANEVSVGQAMLLQIKNRYDAGEISKSNLNLAVLVLNDIQLKCANIVRGSATVAGSYCAQDNLDAVAQYAKSMKENFDVNSVSASEFIAAQERKAVMDAACAP